jgi:uncharacterized protein
VKRLLLAIALCVAFCSSIFCPTVLAQQSDDTPATKEDIQRYFEVTHSRDMANKMMDAMLKPLHQMMHEEYLKNKDKLPEDYEDRMSKRMNEMFKNMPFDEMMQAMIPTYQKHFTKGDIDSLLAFYSSPTGQKLLRELPAIVAESMQSMMPIMRKYAEGMQEQLQQETAELIKQSEKKSGQAARN